MDCFFILKIIILYYKINYNVFRGEYMKITVLVENTTKTECKKRHGLSFYIETKKHKILFDLGPDNTVFENAKIKNIDISKVDIVIISHGHIDHGGALRKFLEINSLAKIYIQKEAFEPHYIKNIIKIPIGINKNLKLNERIILLEGDYKIDDELSLFTVNKENKYYSPINNNLYIKNEKDTFKDEQNLIISEEKTVLIIGCGHSGVVDIIEKVYDCKPSYCIGRFHLFDPLSKKTVSKEFLDEMLRKLKKYDNIIFYTCHCTGKKAFNYLSSNSSNINYISCGESIKI